MHRIEKKNQYSLSVCLKKNLFLLLFIFVDWNVILFRLFCIKIVIVRCYFLIFISRDYKVIKRLPIFLSVNILKICQQVCYCPVDTSLSFAQANKLIRDLRPLHLVVSETYTTPPPQAPLRSDLTIDWVCLVPVLSCSCYFFIKFC